MRSPRPGLVLVLLLGLVAPLAAEPLPDTQPLATEGDLATQMVEGIDKYLMRELEVAAKNRQEFWHTDSSSLETYNKSIEPNREHLRRILGLVPKRILPLEMEYVSTTTQ